MWPVCVIAWEPANVLHSCQLHVLARWLCVLNCCLAARRSQVEFPLGASSPRMNKVALIWLLHPVCLPHYWAMTMLRNMYYWTEAISKKSKHLGNQIRLFHINLHTYSSLNLANVRYQKRLNPRTLLFQKEETQTVPVIISQLASIPSSLSLQVFLITCKPISLFKWGIPAFSSYVRSTKPKKQSRLRYFTQLGTVLFQCPLSVNYVWVPCEDEASVEFTADSSGAPLSKEIGRASCRERV